MRFVPLAVLLLSSFAIAQTPDPTPVDARVSGTVVNEEGKPVPETTVYLTEEASSLVDAMSIASVTDAAGHFDFGRRLKHARYEIYARKEKDGYPDPAVKFYRPLNFSPQYVQLFGDHPSQKVTLELKDKAATLTGRVFDADTGAPLRGSVGLLNLRTDGARAVVAEGGKFEELIPANTDVYVMIEHVPARPDHTDWRMFTAKVNLPPGERMNLDVPLFRSLAEADSGR